MTATLDEANKMLRTAVEARLAGAPIELPDALQGVTLTPAEPMEEATFDDPEPVAQMTAAQLDAAWSGVAEKQRQLHARLREPDAAESVTRRVLEAVPGLMTAEASALRPGSREFFDVLDEVRRLHLSKTLDYGVATDALSNIRQSADVVNLPAWSACVVRMADKMHRLKAFHHRGKTEFDGVPDTLLDLCAYAALALVLYRESTCTKVQ